MPPVVLPDAPLAPSAFGALANSPMLLAFVCAYEPLPLRLGNCAAPTTPSCARDSASRMVAACTSRFSAATRCSSAVSSGSRNRFHQLGSIGSATGMLGGCLIGSSFLANQEAGDSHSGGENSGPAVQALNSKSTPATAVNLINLAPVSGHAPVAPPRGSNAGRQNRLGTPG